MILYFVSFILYFCEVFLESEKIWLLCVLVLVFTGMAQHVPYFAEKDKIGKNKKYGGEKRNIQEKKGNVKEKKEI